ncbi:MAG: tRNA adenosine(34) deaminase TadA [Limnochordia bacterium]|jgi:tRNA(adenine34) deaminase|nr:tRNA adenosine(34) deaminase TadA [Limnochordia bacterium]
MNFMDLSIKEQEQHIRFMRTALECAMQARLKGEVPIGAVVVLGDEIIGRGFNLRETGNDPTAHAEIIALRDAAERRGSWRLTDCDLYVTIEPCPMCAGALILARIRRLIYGADDPKAGAVRSVISLFEQGHWNHDVEVVPGVLSAECGQIMKEFFALRRT